ncbi:hypothetical protein B0T14DRAFT_567595 [Immersiella caudata]|uniref:Uncharacterized protein n=1 Tax=Immersiella caudata TaxID=314043 RepID=A0AA39WSU0_9PEZI|nr:hypothetical protein B0T14DRAFT_567595 [Immersiella caudata]
MARLIVSGLVALATASVAWGSSSDRDHLITTAPILPRGPLETTSPIRTVITINSNLIDVLAGDEKDVPKVIEKLRQICAGPLASLDRSIRHGNGNHDNKDPGHFAGACSSPGANASTNSDANATASIVCRAHAPGSLAINIGARIFWVRFAFVATPGNTSLNNTSRWCQVAVSHTLSPSSTPSTAIRAKPPIFRSVSGFAYSGREVNFWEHE